jgi:hypothetical protein
MYPTTRQMHPLEAVSVNQALGNELASFPGCAGAKSGLQLAVLVGRHLVIAEAQRDRGGQTTLQVRTVLCLVKLMFTPVQARFKPVRAMQVLRGFPLWQEAVQIYDGRIRRRHRRVEPGAFIPINSDTWSHTPTKLTTSHIVRLVLWRVSLHCDNTHFMQTTTALTNCFDV